MYIGYIDGGRVWVCSKSPSIVSNRIPRSNPMAECHVIWFNSCECPRKCTFQSFCYLIFDCFFFDSLPSVLPSVPAQIAAHALPASGLFTACSQCCYTPISATEAPHTALLFAITTLHPSLYPLVPSVTPATGK